MFKKNKQKIDVLSNINMKDEYKQYSRFALIYAVRYCMRHRKDLHNQNDVKKCFDEGLFKYKENKCNKLEDN